MTFAVVGAAMALLIWPGPALDRRRIRALQAVRRLAPTIQPVRSGASRRPSLERIGPGLLALAAIATVAVVTPALGLVAAVEFAICVLAVLSAARAGYRQALLSRRERTREQQVSLAMAVLVGELEAGATVSAALAAAGDVGTDIERRRGGPTRGEATLGDDPLARVIFAWRSSSSTGVPLVDVLARVRFDLNASTTRRRELQAAVAGPQATAAVLALLPVLGVALGTAIGANPISILFATSLGRVLLCLGVVLDAGGVGWTLHLIARAQR